MTLDAFSDAFLAAAGNALLGIVIALFQIVPPIAITILVVVLFARLMKVEGSGGNIVLHGSTFGFIGLIIAYLYSDRAESMVSGLLPQFIAAVVLAFQLAGRMKKEWQVPIESQTTVAAAAATAFCFLFGSIYFEKIRPAVPPGSGITAAAGAAERKDSGSPSADPDLGEEGIQKLLD